MKLEELESKVITFINNKREDDYLDFKQCYHENKADLLHDIICMANNRSIQDGYIIFGVQDKTFKILGIENDINRKNQENIIDFLKSKPFSADMRPKINLRTVNIEDHNIDVLIIYNTLDTPYYLNNDYKDSRRTVKANYIYTRVGDTNTDINKNADNNHIEFLWKKRFGLHLSPYDKLKFFLLQKEKWHRTEHRSYFMSNPEYTLIHESERNQNSSFEFYVYTMTNKNVTYGSICANYFGTKLYDWQTVLLDGGRYITVTPEWGTISHDKYHQKIDFFKYYLKDDISYDLHRYLFEESNDEAVYAHNRFMEVVLLFTDDNEKKCFISYIEEQLTLFEDIIEDNKCNYNYLAIESPEKEQVIRRIKVAKALKKMQLRFDVDGL